jgi:hypothetical protein
MPEAITKVGEILYGDHVEIILNIKLKNKPEFFSCAC